MKRSNPYFEALGYRDASARGRRMIEIRAAAANAVFRLRNGKGLTQAEVAELADSTQDRISKLERVAPGVTLDFMVHVMIALGATDDQVAAAFDPRTSPVIRELRRRASGKYYPRPAPPTLGDYKGEAKPRERSSKRGSD